MINAVWARIGGRSNDLNDGIPSTSTEFVKGACKMDVTVPWGVRFGPTSDERIYLVTRGECCLEAGPFNPIILNEGDVVIVPGETAHDLGSGPGGERIVLDRVIRRAERTSGRVKLGGGGRRASVICASRSAGSTELNLPTLLVAQKRPQCWDQVIGMIDDEVASGQPGRMIMAGHLLGVVIRCHQIMESESLQPQRCDGIALALTRIHRDPTAAWSVEQLAEIAGMSRSGFTGRFTEMVGEAPMRYLQGCRIALAAGLLEAGDAGLNEIADLAGYRSDVALSKAFKKRLGVSPGGYRKATRITNQA